MIPVPSDIDIADRILAGLTARQLAVLAPAAGGVWGLWTLLEQWVPTPVVIVILAPIAAVAVVLVLGRRDGTSLDRLAWAAITHPRAPLSTDETTGSRLRLRWPVTGIDRSGLVDLGARGFAVVLETSMVNIALRSETEQAGLVDGFARLVQSVPGPVQVSVTSRPVDAGRRVRRLHHAATTLPDPKLQAAAAEHADWVSRLTTDAGVRSRHVALTVTGPTPEAAWHAASTAIDACAGFGVTAEVLTGAELEDWLSTSIRGTTC